MARVKPKPVDKTLHVTTEPQRHGMRIFVRLTNGRRKWFISVLEAATFLRKNPPEAP